MEKNLGFSLDFTILNNLIKKLVSQLTCLLLAIVVVGSLCYCHYSINGWIKDGDKFEYYRQGTKVTGVQTVKNNDQSVQYIFDQDGSVQTGWIVYNGHYYYQDINAGLFKGENIIDGHRYFFEDDGVFHGGIYIQDGTAFIRDKYGFCNEGLVSHDGRIYCSDENGRIVYGWKDINGKTRYFDKITGQMLVDGVYFIDGKGYGFDTNGGLLKGWHKYEDGDRFFSLTSGQMYTGDMMIGKSWYFFEEDGSAFTGYRNIDDKVYFYSTSDNSLYTGWLQDGDDFYYYDENGVRAEGLCEIDDKTYFFDKEGKMAYTTWMGNYFFTKEGAMATGFVENDGKIFYFDDKGIRWTESGWKTIGNKRYLFDGNGVVVETADIITINQTNYRVNKGKTAATAASVGGAVTPENLDNYLLGIMAQYGSDPQSIFNYCRQFPYKYRPKQDVTSMACRMLNYKSGACWDYAALCYKMLRLAGYNCQIVVGKGAIYSEHNWILIEVSPGVWRHMDPERKGYYIYMLTDAQLESYDGIARSVRYQWNHGAYPAAQ